MNSKQQHVFMALESVISHWHFGEFIQRQYVSPICHQLAYCIIKAEGAAVTSAAALTHTHILYSSEETPDYSTNTLIIGHG